PSWRWRSPSSNAASCRTTTSPGASTRASWRPGRRRSASAPRTPTSSPGSARCTRTPSATCARASWCRATRTTWGRPASSRKSGPCCWPRCVRRCCGGSRAAAPGTSCSSAGPWRARSRTCWAETPCQRGAGARAAAGTRLPGRQCPSPPGGSMSIQTILSDLESSRDSLEALYRHFHRHPELSLQEYATADRIEQELRASGIEEVLRIGRTGVVAILRNGGGPVVAMRSDTDGLPMAERSGVDYAAEGVTQVDEATGKETPVAHTCGHDFHIVCLLGATQALHAHRDSWSGTFVAVFQPGEENAAGAKAMVAAGIVDKVPRPDVYLGQHVLGSLPGGAVGIRSGPLFSAAAS